MFDQMFLHTYIPTRTHITHRLAMAPASASNSCGDAADGRPQIRSISPWPVAMPTVRLDGLSRMRDHHTWMHAGEASHPRKKDGLTDRRRR